MMSMQCDKKNFMKIPVYVLLVYAVFIMLVLAAGGIFKLRGIYKLNRFEESVRAVPLPNGAKIVSFDSKRELDLRPVHPVVTYEIVLWLSGTCDESELWVTYMRAPIQYPKGKPVPFVYKYDSGRWFRITTKSEPVDESSDFLFDIARSSLPEDTTGETLYCIVIVCRE